MKMSLVAIVLAFTAMAVGQGTAPQSQAQPAATQQQPQQQPQAQQPQPDRLAGGQSAGAHPRPGWNALRPGRGAGL